MALHHCPGYIMQVGIGNYCYHRYFGDVYPDQAAPDKKMSIGDFLQCAQDLGAEGVTIETAFLPSLDKTYMLELKATMQAYDLKPVFAWGHPNGLERGKNDEAFKQMTSLMPFAKMLGCDIMRVVASSYTWRKDDHKEQIEQLVPQFKEAAKQAADNGLKLAIENNGDFTCEELKTLLEQIDSPAVGICFNTGNFIRLLDDPQTGIDVLASNVLVLQLKDVRVNEKEARPGDWFFFSCVPVGQGLVNNQLILDKLHRAGFGGLVMVDIDHPTSDWYDRENEMVELSVRTIVDMIKGQ